jgi:N-acetylmuramoyl-L-alanine amidase
MAKLTLRPSPNFNSRPLGIAPNCILLHATASRSTEQDVKWMQSKASKVSYHDIADRDGSYIRLVDPLKRAWHAGVSSFHGVPDVNDYSIGISFANDDAGEAYPDVQLAAGAALVASYCRRFAIPLDRITRHRDVALPKGRKADPAPPWFAFDDFLARVQQELAV